MDMNKYAHVLKPLKQIEQVWGIDLASVLQEYASEVAEITVDVGGQALNFAEAALLIMGASTIYSRKVDLLKDLVEEAYDLIINRKKAEDGTAKGNDKRKRKRRAVLRHTIRFHEDAVAVVKHQALYRQDVAESLRVMLSNSAFNTGGPAGDPSSAMRVSEGELVPMEDTATGGFNFRVDVCALSNEGLLLPNVRQELMGNLLYEGTDGQTPLKRPISMPRTPGSASESSDVPEHVMKLLIDKTMREEKEKLENEDHISDSDDEHGSGTEEGSEKGARQEPANDAFSRIAALCASERFALTTAERPFERLIHPDKAGVNAEPNKQLLSDLTSDKLACNPSTLKDQMHTGLYGELLFDTTFDEKFAKALHKEKGWEGFHHNAKDRMRKELLAERERARALLTQDGATEHPVRQTADMPLEPIPHSTAGDPCTQDDLDEPDHHTTDCLLEDPGNPTELGLDSMGTQLDAIPDFAVNIELPQAVVASKEEEERYERVKLWREQTEGKLKEQEARPVFDIHLESRKLCDAFKSKGETASFEELVARTCTETWQIPRLFLTALLLTNAANVHLHIDHQYDGKVSDLITLTHVTSDSAFNFEEEPGISGDTVGVPELGGPPPRKRARKGKK